MIIADPVKNTPEESARTAEPMPAAGRDAARSQAADAQGRAENRCTPETRRRHIAMHQMAVEGMDFDRSATVHAAGLEGLSPSLRILIARGMDVYQAVDANGPDGVRSVGDARALRIMLGYASGRLDGLHHDTRASEGGLSLTDIAEIRMGIRERNGSMRREWC